jgi:carbonic anhydrase
VLVQLEHLRTLPSVASRLRRGDLRLHGWMYHLESGEVFAYDLASQEFVPVAEYRAPADGGTRRVGDVLATTKAAARVSAHAA